MRRPVRLCTVCITRSFGFIPCIYTPRIRLRPSGPKNPIIMRRTDVATLKTHGDARKGTAGHIDTLVSSATLIRISEACLLACSTLWCMILWTLISCEDAVRVQDGSCVECMTLNHWFKVFRHRYPLSPTLYLSKVNKQIKLLLYRWSLGEDSFIFSQIHVTYLKVKGHVFKSLAGQFLYGQRLLLVN